MASNDATTTIDQPIAEDGVWVVGPDGDLIPDYESTFPNINEGEIVHGTVVRVDKDEVLVDIGYKSEGVIPVSELSIRRSVNPSDEVTLGDEVDALVLTKEDAEGRLILSKKRARFELAWKEIEAASESGRPVNGRVIEVVKGGLILDLGVRGFLPASLVDIRRVQDLDEFLGTELRCKVIELNRSRNNVVLSRRAVLEDERKEARQAILDRLNPGDVVEGTISNIVDFGAFVDLDGMDGLIHISELSWSHVNHPSEVLEIGQPVKVKVLDIDRDRQRISLGLKQTQTDPWQQVVEAYREGDVVRGKVTKVVTFGAFVEILPGVEGLVHISELAAHHVENPREVVAQGQDVNVRVLEIDAERRRLSLSLKRVEEGAVPKPRPGEQPDETHLDLSEEVFSDTRVAAESLAEDIPAELAEAGAEELSPEGQAVEAPAPDAEPALDALPEADAGPVAEAEPVAEATEPAGEAEPAAEAEPLAEAEPEPEAETEPAAEVELDADDEPAADDEAEVAERDLHRTGF
jgi:small subunit ribosomal protein S1